MPIVARREFGGRFSVAENSKRLSNYRYLEIQLMEMLGGWCHTTPPLAFKAAFGYHVYDHARNADMLAERLAQLRSGREREDPANDDFARLCEHVWNLESTVDRRLAVYRVLEPLLVSTYVYHADATDPMADTPTARLLHDPARIDQRPIPWGQAGLDSLTAGPGRRGPARPRLAARRAGAPAPRARGAGRSRGAPRRLRRGDRPGDRVALADVP